MGRNSVMIETTCAFTGHRPKSFPWKYDESTPDCILLKEVLTAQIKALADKGVTDFLSGMAQGVDLWCAQIVLALRKKSKVPWSLGPVPSSRDQPEAAHSPGAIIPPPHLSPQATRTQLYPSQNRNRGTHGTSYLFIFWKVSWLC